MAGQRAIVMESGGTSLGTSVRRGLPLLGTLAHRLGRVAPTVRAPCGMDTLSRERIKPSPPPR